ATASGDCEIRLWSSVEWREIKPFPKPPSNHRLLNIAFCRSVPVTKAFGKKDVTIRSWAINRDEQHKLVLNPPSLHSVSAKIVFVGESNVGKSCLALRLAEDRYEKQVSTLGMKLWTLPPEKLDPTAIAPPGEKRDVTLWDLGGQDEY